MTGRVDAAVVVLDLDNTLISLDVDWAGVRDELERLARDAGVEVAEPRIGTLMQGAAEPGSEELREAMERALTDAELAGIHGPRNESLIAWLDGPAAGLPVSILSLNSHRAVAEALEHSALAHRITHVVGREDVERGKPDPEGLRLIAEGHGVAVDRLVFVGDADGDRECAARAGTRFLHVDEIGTRWVSATAP